jgi:ankyrin repeat protein
MWLEQGTGTLCANLDAVDPLGNTPLIISAKVNCAPLALLCLRMRASYNTANQLGQVQTECSLNVH